ncbi:AN1-type zinc finger protein 5-like [Grus japonensis]|uniref:AN1-type zinc finger protein 5-like n=1 Tax=Grus japonensis TaxID=30415 RepID=A0ABC9Y2M4_GRUJA
MEKAMVKQAVPLQPMEDDGGVDIDLQPMEDPTPEQMNTPKGGIVVSKARLEKNFKIIKSNCKPSTAKSTTKPCP